MLKIAIVHYHLNPGGVTRIIQSQIQSLKSDNTKIKIICGFCPDPEQYRQAGIELIIKNELNYIYPESISANKLSLLYRRLGVFFRQVIDKDEIIHFHNLNLAKNPVATKVISDMACEGYFVVNHAHDFAEDRPKNIDFLNKIIRGHFKSDLHSVLYPNLRNYLFVVLNSYDFKRIEKFAIDMDRRFLLPNPVGYIQENQLHQKESFASKIIKILNLEPGKKIIIYPVRVIQRKNIGEFILLSTLFKNEAHWLVTLPPKNPFEIKFYEKWKKFCYKERIPVHFEVGLSVEFTDLMYASDFCITTSIREGFGMVFIEPWLFGTPVVGRDIPYITEDLKKSGMNFPRFYQNLHIENGIKDFIDLTIEDQMEYVHRVNRSNVKKQNLMTMNPVLKNLLQPVGNEIISNNVKTIKENYSLEKYTERLNAIYQTFFK
ncbi:MAG: glycosyltransferase family 4 protein [Bacteroidales bacterium]|nr:glycosyltransferase family 4 protein [Bacteroidales bacterium]